MVMVAKEGWEKGGINSKLNGNDDEGWVDVKCCVVPSRNDM